MLTQVFVLNGFSGFPFRFDNIMSLLCEMLDKHFLHKKKTIANAVRLAPQNGKSMSTNRGDRNDKRSVSRTLHDIIVKLNNLFYPRHWTESELDRHLAIS